MDTRRIALLLGGLVAGVVGGFPTAAAADCSGPVISVAPATAGRGEVVTVTGDYFGTNCYDTGPPPAGEGPLGRPADDIEIVLGQDTTELVVARGAADTEYAFAVEVTVPADLQPGEILFQARSDDLFSTALQPFVVTDAPPTSSSSNEIATFGPASPAGPTVTQPRTTEPDGSSDSDNNSPLLPILAAAAVAATGATALTLWRRRRTQPSPASQ